MEKQFKNNTLLLVIILCSLFIILGAYYLVMGGGSDSVAESTNLLIRIIGAITTAAGLYVLSDLQVSFLITETNLIFKKYKFFREENIIIQRDEVKSLETPYVFLRKGILVIFLKNKEEVRINFNYMHLIGKDLTKVKVRQYIHGTPAFLEAVTTAKFISCIYKVPYKDIFTKDKN